MASMGGDNQADTFERTLDELVEFAASLTPEQFATLVPGENWSVGCLLNHVADGFDNVTGWIDTLIAGGSVDMTVADIDAANVEMQARNSAVDQATTVARLRDGGATALERLRALDDDALGTTGFFAPAEAEVTVAALCVPAWRHGAGHLANARAALGLE